MSGLPAQHQHQYQHRLSASRQHAQDETTATGLTHTISTQRFEEAALARQGLDEAKRENEVLRQRVMELEGLLRRRRASSSGRRSEPGEEADSEAAG